MLHRLRFLLPLLAPAALGALSVAGFAPWAWYGLPILALAGLFWLARADYPRAAFRKGYAFGLGWFGAGVSWVYVSLHDFGMMPAPLAVVATALFCAFLALFPALSLALAARLAPPGGWRWLAAAPAAWVLLEWTRGWIFTGFPWQALGYAQIPASPLAGYAPLLGVYGVSWLAALSAGALALVGAPPHRGPGRASGVKRRFASRRLSPDGGKPLLQGGAGGRLPPLIFIALLWAGGLGLQQVEWTRPAGAPVTVSLLQGNVPQTMKFQPERLAQTLLDYRQLTLASRSRLIVLPETALPLYLDRVPRFYLEELAEHARAQGGDLLVGVPESLPDGRYFNSVVSLGTAPTQTYRKQHLVPFGEFVPPGFGWIVEFLDIPLSDFSRGETVQAPFEVAGQRVAVNICYEDAFGEELIRALPAATLLVNVSNDAWFGDSFAPWQHLQLAQARALETGRPMLRANNTGITAVIDPRGRVTARLPPFTQGALHAEVRGYAGLTPYARWGNAPAVALALAALAAAVWAARRGRTAYRAASTES